MTKKGNPCASNLPGLRGYLLWENCAAVSCWVFWVLASLLLRWGLHVPNAKGQSGRQHVNSQAVGLLDKFACRNASQPEACRGFGLLLPLRLSATAARIRSFGFAQWDCANERQRFCASVP